MHGTIDNQIARHRPARADSTARSFDAHPAGARSRGVAGPAGSATPTGRAAPDGRSASPARWDDEQGSLVTEYGLLAVVAATVAGVIIQWASGGALVTLFNALLRQARALVGA
ncbi:MAG: hypothetical protein EA388_01885 [Nitriliruptor sp.]|nr:MAG: hypothetical protein EA388_01885 [Nitriliruptor sp.]